MGTRPIFSVQQIEHRSGAELRKVQKDGWTSYKNRIIEMGIGLSGEHVEVRETDYGVEIYYGPYRILEKRFDKQTKTRDDKVGGSRRRSRTVYQQCKEFEGKLRISFIWVCPAGRGG